VIGHADHVELHHLAGPIKPQTVTAAADGLRSSSIVSNSETDEIYVGSRVLSESNRFINDFYAK